MGNHHLTPEEKETLRVMKMQEGELEQLQIENEAHHQHLNEMGQRLEALKERARHLAQAEGVDVSKEHHYPTAQQEPDRMNLEEIPSWASLIQQAKEKNVSSNTSIEDLLNEAEITRYQEDTKRIEEEFAQLTGLTKRDMAFLPVATYLQTARWTTTGKTLPTKSLATIGNLPTKVNMTIEQLHTSMYDPEKDGPWEFYEARTRKILMLSNLLASTSNVAFAASTELWSKIDTEGLITTISRLAQDGAYLINLRDAYEKIKMDQVLEKALHDIDSHFKHLPTKD